MNKNFIKSLALSIALLFTSSIPVFADINVSRISGYDRYETSINANKKYMNQANGNLAVITSGNDFKTALYGSYMASSLNVPYFVNPKHGVRTDILNELKKLNVNRVYVMGDYNMLDKSVDNTLKSKGIKIERIRYISSEEFWGPGHGFPITELNQVNQIIDNTFNTKHLYNNWYGNMLINSNAFPDILSVIPFAAEISKNFTFGLVDYSDEIRFLPPYDFVVGGINTIPEYFPESIRFNGQNRYETAVEIAKEYKVFLNKDIKTAIIVNGENYPDALSSSLVATQNNGAVLLTQLNKLNEYTAKYIKDNNIKNVIIVGGEKSVSRNVENELKSLN